MATAKEVTPHRLTMLTDGIFAIVMTLLVLELKLPEIHGHVTPQSLLDALIHQAPHFISYIVSFIVLGNYWVAHHTEFQYINKLDHKLIWLNVLFLMFISLLPFSASLLGHYPDNTTAVVFYGANLLISGLIHMYIWIHATSSNLTEKGLPKKFIQFGNLLSLFAIIPYMAAIVLAFLDPRISIFIYILVPIPFVLGLYYRFLK